MFSIRHFVKLLVSAVIFIAISFTAYAADMLVPQMSPRYPAGDGIVMQNRGGAFIPPPSLETAQQLNVGGGLYLRGDIGISMQSHNTIEYTPTASTYTPISGSVSNTVFLDGGVGYAYNNWLRGDLTLEYRFATKVRSTENNNRGTPADLTDDYVHSGSGNMSAFVGLANVYADLGTWQRVTPYVGFGLGMASLKFSGFNDVGYGIATSLHKTAADISKTNFAWAIHAGFSFDVAQNLKLDVGYRYLNLGKAESGAFGCTAPCQYKMTVSKFDSHDIRIGLRYYFGTSFGSTASASYATAYPYTPPPVDRCCAVNSAANSAANSYGSYGYTYEQQPRPSYDKQPGSSGYGSYSRDNRDARNYAADYAQQIAPSPADLAKMTRR